MQLRHILRSSKLPYTLAAFQWAILVLVLALDLHFTVSVTGAFANGGQKVITILSVWMLLFSSILCLMFYRRKTAVADKGIFFLSILTILFSGANISLHFVNDLVLAMKATEIIAWTCYNSMFFVTLYQVSHVFLFPAIIGDRETEQRNNRNPREVKARG